jgi:hypothetical protein
MWLLNIVYLMSACVLWNGRKNKVAAFLFYYVSFICYLDMCVYFFLNAR